MNEAEIIRSVQHVARQNPGAKFLMAQTVNLLRSERPHYDWVGIYLLRDGELILGPYLGKLTPHTRIPLNQGICGAAASSGQTIVVDDVHADPRYLACSLETRSEIVVPIIHNGRVLGEIDVDSDTSAAFTDADRLLLEAVSAILASNIA